MKCFSRYCGISATQTKEARFIVALSVKSWGLKECEEWKIFSVFFAFSFSFLYLGSKYISHPSVLTVSLCSLLSMRSLYQVFLFEVFQLFLYVFVN
jgi:hypothetical protein